MNKMIGTADYLGMTASGVCLLHCLGAPLLMLLFPFLGLTPQEDVFHASMALAVAIPAVLAFTSGFLLHRSWLVFGVGGFGLLCLITAMLVVEPLYGETAETILTVVGGLHLITAHYMNRKCCNCCVPLKR